MLFFIFNNPYKSWRIKNMMPNLDRAHVLLKDDRKDIRIQEDEDLSWQIKYKQREGSARIRNISASGMMMETDVVFDPKEECVLSFDSNLGDENYIPQVGRIVWHKKKRFSRNKYLCGVKFLDADEKVLARMRERVRVGVNRFVRMRRITTTIGLVLCVAVTVLIGYLIWSSSVIYKNITKTNRNIFQVTDQQAMLTAGFIRLYRASEMSLADKTEKLDIANQIIAQDKAAIALFAQELEATGALLDRTEEMLAQANNRNVELTNEIQGLRGQAIVPVGEISTGTEIEMTMEEYRRQIQLIKNAMKRLKEKEYADRMAILAEIDNQRLLLGNNGYFIKEGQIVQVNEDQYRRLDPGNVSQSNRNVEIDITFFE
jgi:hypothetical protein